MHDGDIGSTTAKAVVIDEDGRISRVLPIGAKPSEAGESALRAALEDPSGEKENLKYVVATGYGRVLLDSPTKR